MKWKAVSLKNEQKLGEMCTQCTIKRADVTINYSRTHAIQMSTRNTILTQRELFSKIWKFWAWIDILG